MIINIAGVWRGAEIKHAKYVDSEIDRVTASIVKNEPSTKIRRLVLAFARRHRSSFCGSTKEGFNEAIAQYERTFPAGPTRDEAHRLFRRIFNYDRFSEKKGYGKRWTAFDLCKEASFVICPYCHLNSAATELPNIAARTKGYRPQLDHFLPKAVYPFLSLSLGNLIPVCGECNGSSMKHDAMVHVVPILNPLFDRQAIRFFLAQTIGDDPLLWNLQGPNNAYRIELLVDRDFGRASRSIQLFQLSSRYNEASKVSGVLDQMRELSRSPDQTRILFPFVAKQDYRRLENDGYKNRHWGKLLIDLHEQLCVPL